MKDLARRVLGALGICVTWAAGWAAAGVLTGAASLLLPGLPWDRFFEFFDAPLPALGMPGFIGGALFCAVLGLLKGRGGFDGQSLAGFAARGALAGLLLSLVPAAMAAAGLATLNRPGFGVWRITAVISGPLILMSAVSAAGTLLLARKAKPWRTLVVQLLPGDRGAA